MYKQITVLIVALMILNYNYAQTGNSDSIHKNMNSKEEAFARQVFEAFKNNDEALYANLQPTNEEYKALLQLVLAAKVEGITQQKIDEMMEWRKKEAPERMKSDFNKFQHQADSCGITWADAVYQNYDWQEMYPKEFHQKYLYGTVWFAINGVRYMIEDLQAVEIPTGYKLQKIYRIRKAEE